MTLTPFSKILCVVDPMAKEQPALARAVWLARHSGASIELLLCYYNEYLSGGRFFDSTSLKKARAETLDVNLKKLEALAEPIRKYDLTVTTSSVWHHPLYEGIAGHAIDTQADLVFKDTHHHSVLARTLFSNTDWNLIRTCPVPLWLVNDFDLDDAHNIIAAIDPLHEHDKPAALDDHILAAAKMIANEINGTVHAFHAYDPRIALSAATANAYIPVSLPLQEIEEEVRNQHLTRFTEITNFHEIPDDCAHLVSGLVHEELPDLARELKANLVVIGAVSRSRLKRWFIGATAERTLELLPCDLLVLKPGSIQSAVEAETEIEN